MAEELVKIRNVKSGTVCECSAGSAAKLTDSPQWEYVKAPARASAAKSDD